MSAAPAEMDRPSIAYVDESPDELENFYGDAFDSGLFAEIHLVHPDNDLDALIQRLLDLRIDALVSDFNLADAGPKAYTGAQVVEAFLDIRDDFPCFIRTSYDEAALKSSNDVNRVYSKNMADEDSVGRNLFRRIALQVDHHRGRLAAWQAEFGALMMVPDADRTAADVERILELDSALERHAGKDQMLPASVKRAVLTGEGLFAREAELLRRTEDLIAAMKQATGD